MIDDSSEDPLPGLCDELEEISATGRSIIETLPIKVAVSTDADCKRGGEGVCLIKCSPRKMAGWDSSKFLSKLKCMTMVETTRMIL